MRLLAAMIGLAALAAAAPAHAEPTGYDSAFVDAFAEACVPGRLSYAASREAALAAGWSEVAPDIHPELAAIIALGEAEAVIEEPGISDARFDYTAYAKDVAGSPHHLLVSRASAVIGDPDDPLNPWVWVGCHLYNLDATAPLDPEPVTALIGNPISASQHGEGAEGHVWGPPCPMPRTGDTYLNFIAEGSPFTEILPFTGISLNFTTSELSPGEEPPAPYC